MILTNLRALRWERAYSIRDLALAAGVSPATIVNAEQGRRTYPKSVRKLAIALGVTPAELAGQAAAPAPAALSGAERVAPPRERQPAAEPDQRRERMLAQLVGQADRAAERGDAVGVARIAAMLAELDGTDSVD